MSTLNPDNCRRPSAQTAALTILCLLAQPAHANESTRTTTTQATNLAVDAIVTSEPRKDASVITFTVRVINKGPGFAKGVLLETIVDSNVLAKLGGRRMQSTSSARCHDEILACEIGDLAADDVVTVQIVSRVATTEATTVGLEFRIASQAIDSVPFDNRYYSSVFVPER